MGSLVGVFGEAFLICFPEEGDGSAPPVLGLVVHDLGGQEHRLDGLKPTALLGNGGGRG